MTDPIEEGAVAATRLNKYIGRIDIHDYYTVLDLPAAMPKELLMHLKNVWASDPQLRIH